MPPASLALACSVTVPGATSVAGLATRLTTGGVTSATPTATLTTLLVVTLPAAS